jgi:1D-myo-inositol 3-kinase
MTDKILVVGNYCHDTLVLPTGTFNTLGGSSSYISAVLSSMPGVNFSVIAKVGSDFLYTDKIRDKPLISGKTKTTHFVDDLTGEVRTERVKSICEPISGLDIPKGQAGLGIACGVAMEILPETVRALRKQCETVIADAQALLRNSTPEGRIFLRDLAETNFMSCLECFDFIKASEHEAPFIDLERIRKHTTVIITQGPKGCKIVDKTKEYSVPAVPVEEIDSTGAGDCFMAGFAYGLSTGLSVMEAAKQGNRFGAIAVQVVGVPDFSKYSTQS